MTYSENEVRQMVRDWVGDRSLSVAGRELGVSAPWLCQMLTGYRYPCGVMLDKLGLRRIGRGERRERDENGACIYYSTGA